MPDEPRIPGIRRAPRVPGRAVEKDVDDELAFHIESRTQELVHEGMQPNDARGVAEAEFGDLVAARRELAVVDRRRRRRERLARLADIITQGAEKTG